MSAVGIELEWAVLFLVCALSSSLFDAFEVGTAWWRKLARWLLAAALTIGGHALIGHWSLLLLAGFAALGLGVHLLWCRKHGIDPLTAEPSDRYRALRGWDRPEEREGGH